MSSPTSGAAAAGSWLPAEFSLCFSSGGVSPVAGNPGTSLFLEDDGLANGSGDLAGGLSGRTGASSAEASMGCQLSHKVHKAAEILVVFIVPKAHGSQHESVPTRPHPQSQSSKWPRRSIAPLAAT